MRAKYKAVNPDKVLRDLRKEFKQIQKGDPDPERVEDLATFCRAAHDIRQLNMSMHAAQLCLDEDPDAPDALVRAYEAEDGDVEEQLRAYIDLEDLARYIDAGDVREYASGRIDELAWSWVRDGDEAERRHRLRTIASMRDRAYADALRDRLRFG